MKYIESIRIQDGEVQNIEYHRRRMQSNTTAGLSILDELKTSLDGRVKSRIIYDTSKIISVEYFQYRMPIIKSLKIIEAPNIIYDKKFQDRSSLDRLFKQRMECDDVLICRNGVIGDTYFCNLVFVDKEGKFYTTNCPILRGTKCQSLLDSGKVIERRITIKDINNYRGLYLVNAMIDIEDELYISVDDIIR